MPGQHKTKHLFTLFTLFTLLPLIGVLVVVAVLVGAPQHVLPWRIQLVSSGIYVAWVSLEAVYIDLDDSIGYLDTNERLD